MAKSNKPFFSQFFINTITKIEDSDGTAFKQIAVGSAEDSRIYSIILTTDSGAANNIVLGVGDGVDINPVTTIAMGAFQGSDGISNPVNMVSDQRNLFRQIDANNNAFIGLELNKTLHVRVETAIVTNFTLWISVLQENY